MGSFCDFLRRPNGLGEAGNSILLIANQLVAIGDTTKHRATLKTFIMLHAGKYLHYPAIIRFCQRDTENASENYQREFKHLAD